MFGQFLVTRVEQLRLLDLGSRFDQSRLPVLCRNLTEQVASLHKVTPLYRPCLNQTIQLCLNQDLSFVPSFSGDLNRARFIGSSFSRGSDTGYIRPDLAQSVQITLGDA